jgi:hypothetical protein
LVVFLFVLQIAVVLSVSFHYRNPAKISYRRAERAAAIQAYHKEPSPENKVTMDKERHLASRFVGQQQLIEAGILLGVLLSVEGALYYFWQRRRFMSPFAP